MNKGSITYVFERFRFVGEKVSDYEAKTIKIKDTGDGEKNQTKAYRHLFKKFPEWGNGRPIKNGIGFSSAMIKFPQC